MKRPALLMLLILAAVCLFALALSGWHVVRPGEQIVVRRLGGVVQPTWGPGFHWGFPLGIDRFDRVRTDHVRQLTVGSTETADRAADASAGEFLTGDLNLVQIQSIVQYRVENPAEFVVRSADIETVLQRLAEASLSGSLSRRGIDAVLRADRQVIATEVERELSDAVKREHLGVAILGVSLTEARPPAEVAPDFIAAVAAESHRDRRIQEARSYTETTATAAKAASQAQLDIARAAADRKTVGSKAQSHRFLSLMAEAQRSRTLTTQRVYLDSMKSLLGQVRRKLVLPAGDAVDLTVLGLDE
jgi:membrane protease subunit HflK